MNKLTMQVIKLHRTSISYKYKLAWGLLIVLLNDDKRINSTMVKLFQIRAIHSVKK